MIYKIIPFWVASQAALVAIIADRVEPNVSKQGESRPRIVYHRISSRRIRNLAGNTGLRWTRVQFDCYGFAYSQACQIAALLQNLDGATQTINGVVVKASLPDEERDDAQAEAGNANLKPMVSVDILFAHEE